MYAQAAIKNVASIAATPFTNLQSALGRSCPELNAQLMFEPDEWSAAFILNQKRPPDQAPTLNEVVRLVARLGGFLARTGDGEPGVKTIWLGMQRILDFAAGVRFSRELQAEESCV